MVTREVDQIRVLGKLQPVCVFELVGSTGEVPTETLEAIEHYQSALNCYRKGDYPGALSVLKGHEDGPAQWLAEFIATYTKSFDRSSPQVIEVVTDRDVTTEISRAINDTLAVDSQRI